MAEARYRHRERCPQRHNSNTHQDLPEPRTGHQNWGTAVGCRYMDIQVHMHRGHQWVHRLYPGDPLLVREKT